MASSGAHADEPFVAMLRAAPGYVWWQTPREIFVSFEVAGMVSVDAVDVKVSAACAVYEVVGRAVRCASTYVSISACCCAFACERVLQL